MGKVFKVDAQWDPEASVFVATSKDVPGLVTEAPDEKALAAKLAKMVPEMLVLNHVVPAGTQIQFRVRSQREVSVDAV
jgi:hypothetical protein